MQKRMGTLGRPAEESRVGRAEEWVPVDEMNKEGWSKGWGGEPHPQRRDLHSNGESHSVEDCNGVVEPEA